MIWTHTAALAASLLNASPAMSDDKALFESIAQSTEAIDHYERIQFTMLALAFAVGFSMLALAFAVGFSMLALAFAVWFSAFACALLNKRKGR